MHLVKMELEINHQRELIEQEINREKQKAITDPVKLHMMSLELKT